MTEDKNLNNQEEPKEPKSGTPAEALKTVDREADEPKNRVSLERFNEVNEKNKKLALQLEQVESDKKDETEQRLADQEKWEELAKNRGVELADAKAKAARVDSYEETLASVLEAQAAQIPKEYRALIPEELTTQQKLDWIAHNKQLLMKSTPFDIGAGKRGGTKEESVDLTVEQKQAAKDAGVSNEDYAKRIVQ